MNVNSFYGDGIPSKTRKPYKSHAVTKDLPRRLNNLFGPTQVWKVFHRQKDALEYAKFTRNGLLPFAFQQSDGVRLFLVAHPQIFWYLDIQKQLSERCSYEIISESCACKLYFDLEFDFESNPGKKGSFLVDTFITVILYFISVLLNITTKKENILILDSSTHIRFSRHLIFQLNSHAFCDNRSVGEFVGLICQKIRLYIDSQVLNDTLTSSCDFELYKCKCCEGPELKNSGCIKKIGLSLESLKNLLVMNRNGKRVMLCDESVYSRNRHFRLFQNTKWRKNSPLVLSEDNIYRPFIKRGTESEPVDEFVTEAFFLDSLITYFRPLEDSAKDIEIINFQSPLKSKVQLYSSQLGPNTVLSHELNSHLPKTSKYPDVDKHINKLVFPGHIWRNAYFISSSTIVYDIVGNRYCHNIGREHRSNNVKYIVNLDNFTYYQKCHDPECSSFRSNPLTLPPEIKFKLEDDCFTADDVEELITFSENEMISDLDLMEVASVVEDLSTINSEESLC